MNTAGSFDVVSPATGRVIAHYPRHSPDQARARLDRAHQVQRGWAARPFAERAEPLRSAGRLLRDRAPALATLMTDEMGKTIAAGESEVEKCAWVCEHFAEHGEAMLTPEHVQTEAASSYVRFDPLGVVLAIMPWNFPLWQVFRCAAPALMAGNGVALKHASNVPGCALAIERLFVEAGLPEGVFTTLLVPSEDIENLLKHAAIAAVSLTGSEAAGTDVAVAAGRVLKKTVLELGGSDPFIVLADADVPKAAEQAVSARMINNGQSCIAAKRFIVEEPVAERFEIHFLQAMSALEVGDPKERATRVGPLAREDLLETLDSQVQRSLALGARLLLGGTRIHRPGFYYAPTLLAGVVPGMPVFDEETFGPVAAIVRARDTEEAVALANQSPYGLGASVWTRDTRRAEEVAARLEAGVVFVNEIVKSDPRLPFGGVKRSGHGRELAEFGIREFVNIKTVWVA